MPEKLQIICFKINNDQLISIDDLIRDQLYFSRSEIFRMAIRYLLMKLSSDPAYHISRVPWNREVSNGSVKDSISSKLPPILLKCVDEVVTQEIFTSRSHFIRESLRIFLEDRSILHDVTNGGEIAS
ncbi:MAG: ribbon-helix-helix domain-containing protein [Candidatus Hodarchaeales archaeon]|jgi:metal-responsive CopG/Arc/MetJ family transcriptional regulator